MSASQILKKTQTQIPMEIEVNNQTIHPVNEYRTQKPTSADRYQQVMLDSAALGAIDRAWLDAQKEKIIDPGIIEEVEKLGKTYSDNPSTNNAVRSDMVLIDGFHKDCPKEVIIDIINTFITTHNIQIDISYATAILEKTHIEYSFSTNRERFSIILRLVDKQHFSLAGSALESSPAISCKVEVSKRHPSIPATFATTYRCMAIVGDTNILKPELTPTIETLCVIRGISFEAIGIAKSIILTNKYLASTFATNAVRNARYVIIPKTISHPPKSKGSKWADELLLEIFTSVPNATEIANGNMGIDLKTYQDRLPTTPGNNTISLDRATKVSIYVDSDLILNHYIPDNLILQTAPQTVIKNIGHGASAEQILQALILDNGNFTHLNNKINAVWKSPGQRRQHNTQLDRYIIQHIPGFL